MTIKNGMNIENLIMSDLYLEMADYITGVIYNNPLWEDPDYSDFDTLISLEHILENYGGYHPIAVKFCFNIIRGYIIGNKTRKQDIDFIDSAWNNVNPIEFPEITEFILRYTCNCGFKSDYEVCPKCKRNNAAGSPINGRVKERITIK